MVLLGESTAEAYDSGGSQAMPHTRHGGDVHDFHDEY